jgi:ribosomal protein S27AE
MGQEVTNEERKCPMCGNARWILLDGVSTLQALEGGIRALAYSCTNCGFMRWHRVDKAERS